MKAPEPDKIDAKVDDPKGDRTQSNALGVVSFKAIVATLGAGLVSLFVALSQIWYKQSVETYARQDQQGFEFQAALLANTGKIERRLIAVANSAKAGRPDDTLARIREFEEAYELWAESDLLQRNLGSQLYGREVGRRIYDLSEQSLKADACGVVHRVQADFRPQNCATRRAQQLEALTTQVLSIRQQRTDPGIATSASDLPSFHTSVRLARETLSTYRFCLDPASRSDRTWALRCGDLASLQRTVVRRAELVRIARERIATAIVMRSSFRD